MAELPAYRVIYNAILKKINKGKYSKGSAIPSENELARMFGVSRMTARKSVDLLVAEGYLLREKGRGTFPTGRSPAVQEELSLSGRLAAQDRRVYSEVLAFKTTLETSAAGAELSEPLTCWRIDRLRFVDDQPAVYERVWIPVGLADAMTQEQAAGSLVDYLSHHLELGTMLLTGQPDPAPKKKAVKVFGKKKRGLLLKVTSQLTSVDSVLCLWSESWQDPKVMPFTIHLVKA